MRSVQLIWSRNGFHQRFKIKCVSARTVLNYKQSQAVRAVLSRLDGLIVPSMPQDPMYKSDHQAETMGGNGLIIIVLS